MALKAGSIADLTSSMAKAMEDAFLEEWPLAMGDQELPKMNNQMRLMFVAIAKGVVRHLNARESSFRVTMESREGHTHPTTVAIDIES